MSTASLQTKPKSHIQQWRDAAEHTMHRVLYVLQTSEEDYCWYKYLCGLNWLQHYLNGDGYTIDMLERSKVFWGWWKSEWHRRDQAFLEDAETLITLRPRTRLDIWFALHSPKELASRLSPHAAVMDEGFDDVMQEIMFGYKRVKI